MSWVVWICRRSWAEIGGAMWEMREVKVGRALERRSVPGQNQSSNPTRINPSSITKHTEMLQMTDIPPHLLRPPQRLLIPSNLLGQALRLLDGRRSSREHTPPPASPSPSAFTSSVPTILRLLHPRISFLPNLRRHTQMISPPRLRTRPRRRRRRRASPPILTIPRARRPAARGRELLFPDIRPSISRRAGS